MKKQPFVRSEYNYDMLAASDACGLCCEDESLAKQSFAEEADINTIVRRFHLTGELPQNVTAPVYQDFEGVFDFQSALNQVRSASESFMAMPADVRARFNNDPASFVAFCSDERNREDAEKLGLVFKRKKAENGGPSEVTEKGGSDGGRKGDFVADAAGRADVGKGAAGDNQRAGTSVGEKRSGEGEGSDRR